MARQYFTVTDLRNTITDINYSLSTIGSKIRFETGGRNGYQAVDEYSVDDNGERIGSGVNRNVCCGSSRECSEATWVAYYNEHNRIERGSHVESNS